MTTYTPEQLRCLSFDSAETRYLDGRMTLHDWNRFRRLWIWSAPRFAGIPGMIQEQYFRDHGADAYSTRIRRVRRVLRFPD